MNRRILLLILVFPLFLHAFDDGYIEINQYSDSLTIWHYGAWRNCGAIYTMDIQMVDSTIYMMENDTSGDWLHCMCNFDLAVTIGQLPAGRYHLIIHTTDKFNGDTALVADTTFSISDIKLISSYKSECLFDDVGSVNQTEIPLIEHYESSCNADTTTSLSIFAWGNNLQMSYQSPPINYNIQPRWKGYLSSDTFYVTMEDTGAFLGPALCPHFLSATFGPFPDGRYVLNFLDGKLGYPTFLIGETVNLDVEGNELILNWNVSELNCCLVPQWSSWLGGNVFHVTMNDVGAPCDCICPFELSARFGPFQPGVYTLNFHNSLLGPFVFIIGDIRKPTTLIVLGSYQSGCYDPQLKVTDDNLPVKFALLRCYPNPFNPITKIAYQVPIQSEISLDIYDIRGTLIENLTKGVTNAGFYLTSWDAARYPSGIYFVRLTHGSQQLIGKLLLLK